jgi:hypothetical protein
LSRKGGRRRATESAEPDFIQKKELKNLQIPLGPATRKRWIV